MTIATTPAHHALGSEKDHTNGDGGKHHTLHDDGHPGHDNHISWDTDKDGDYVKGGQDRDGRRIDNWPDRGRSGG